MNKKFVYKVGNNKKSYYSVVVIIIIIITRNVASLGL